MQFTFEKSKKPRKEPYVPSPSLLKYEEEHGIHEISMEQAMQEVQKYGCILTKEERKMNLSPMELELKRQREAEAEMNAEIEAELARIRQEQERGVNVRDNSIKVESDSPFYGEEDMIFEGATRYTAYDDDKEDNKYTSNNVVPQQVPNTTPITFSNPELTENPYLQGAIDTTNIPHYGGRINPALMSDNPESMYGYNGRRNPYMVQGIDIRTIPRMNLDALGRNSNSKRTLQLPSGSTITNPALINTNQSISVPRIEPKRINYDDKYIYCDNSLNLYQDNSFTSQMNQKYENKLQNMEAKSLLEKLDDNEEKTEIRKEDNMNFNIINNSLEQNRKEKESVLANEKNKALEQEKNKVLEEEKKLKEKEYSELVEQSKAKMLKAREERRLQLQKQAEMREAEKKKEQERLEAQRQKEEKVKQRTPIVYVNDRGAIVENTADDSDMINIYDLITANIKITDGNGEPNINIPKEHINPIQNNSFNNNQYVNSMNYNQDINNYYNQNTNNNYVPDMNNYYDNSVSSNDSFSGMMNFIEREEYSNNYYNNVYNNYNNGYNNQTENQELLMAQIQEIKDQIFMLKEIQNLKSQINTMQEENNARQIIEEPTKSEVCTSKVMGEYEIYEDVETESNEPYVVSGVTIVDDKQEDRIPLGVVIPTNDEAVYVDDSGQITEKPKLIKYYKCNGVKLDIEGELDEDYLDRTNLFIEAKVFKPDGTRYSEADYDKIPYYTNRKNYQNPNVFYTDRVIEVDDTPLSYKEPTYKTGDEMYNSMIQTISNNSWKTVSQHNQGLIRRTFGASYNIDENGQIPYCEFPTYAEDENGKVVAYVVKNGKKVFLENNDPFEFTRELYFSDGRKLSDTPYDLPFSKGIDSDEIYTDDIYYKRYQDRLNFKASLPVDNNKVGEIDYSRLSPEVAEKLRQRQASYEFQEKKKQLEITKTLAKCVNKILNKNISDEEMDKLYSVENLIKAEEDRIEEENLLRLQRYSMGIGIIDKQKYDELVWRYNFLLRRMKACEYIPPDISNADYCIRFGWLYLDMYLRKYSKNTNAEKDLTALYDRDAYLREVHKDNEVQRESFIIPNCYALTEDDVAIYAETAKRMKDERLFRRTQFLKKIIETKNKKRM